jgi:hypothetical protein
MTPGGEKAVKAADGVGLKSVIHRAQISIATICCSKLDRRFFSSSNCHAIAISFCNMTYFSALILI